MQRNEIYLTTSIGLIISFSIIAISLAFAHALYSGPLHEFLPWGTRMMLLSSGVVILIIALKSSVPIVVARPQDEPLPLILIMVQGLAIYVSQGKAEIITVVVAIMLTTILTGIMLYLIGKFKWGNFVRFVPFPVVTGFLASTGLLLIMQGLIDVLPKDPISAQYILELFTLKSLLIWLPAILFGVLAFIIAQSSIHPLAFPGLLLFSIVIFYSFVFFLNLDIEELRNSGQLIAGFEGKYKLKDINWGLLDFGTIDFKLIAKSLIQMLIISLVSVIALLFITISLELILKKDIDFNEELKIAGIANLFGGLLGGIVGYHGLGNTVFAASFKVHTRALGILCGIVLILSVFFAGQGITYFPKFLLSGLVIFLGLALFYEWTFGVWKRLEFLDKAVLLVVLLVTLLFGFLQGVLAGVLISIIFFIFTYSQINIVRYIIDGTELRSSYQRTPVAQKILNEHGKKFVYIKLEGYLFFGSANALVNLFHSLYKKNHNLKFLIYDFERVKGMDSSVVMSFEKIAEYAKQKNLQVIITGYKAPRVAKLILKIRKILETEHLKKIADVDQAVNSCEEEIIEQAGLSIKDLENQIISLDEFLTEKSVPLDIVDYFEDVFLKKGELLVKQGERSTDLFYLEQGKLGIFITISDTRKKFLSHIGSGNIIGEIAFYSHSTRSASIIAQADCKLKKLSQQSLKKIHITNPSLNDAFNRAIICLLSEKLIMTTKTLQILTK